jgi:hypothetical protein
MAATAEPVYPRRTESGEEFGLEGTEVGAWSNDRLQEPGGEAERVEQTVCPGSGDGVVHLGGGRDGELGGHLAGEPVVQEIGDGEEVLGKRD